MIGVLRGMGITLKNFLVSYIAPRRPADLETGGIVTVQYPDEKLPEKERYRNFPFLVFDENPADPRCVACDICAKECPPKCIYIVRDVDEQGRALKKPKIFDIDVTVCMNCGICEEACPFDAIFMDHDFEVGGPERLKTFVFDREKLLKPTSHLEKIRPNDFAAIEDRRRKDAEKKAAAAKAAAAGAPPPAPPAPPTPPPQA